MNNVLKDNIIDLKDKLEFIEHDLESKLLKLHIRENTWRIMEDHIEDIRNNQHNIVALNIGGKLFATRKETLLSPKDSLFCDIIQSNRFKLDKEIFIDRDPKLFPYILEFLRSGNINFKRFNQENKDALLREAEYYGIKDLSNNIHEINKPIKFISFDINLPYLVNDKTIGSNNLEDIIDLSKNEGICANAPARIIIELNQEWEFAEIEVGGYMGDKSNWNHKKIEIAKIYTSNDKMDWTLVGTVPKGIAKKTNIIVKKTKAKYIKFESSGKFGIGYLNIKKN
jgi:hypothetical protein